MHRRLVILVGLTLLACGATVAEDGGGPVSVDASDVARRIRGRTYPSVFQAWAGAENVQDESRLHTMARHDLVFHGVGGFGLRWDGRPSGLATRLKPDSIPRGRDMRRRLLALNPNLVLLAEIRYRDASGRFLPDDHPFWRRRDGKRIAGWAEGGFYQLDFSSPAYRAHVARRAGAVVASGVVDGVMLDWWRDDDDRLALVRAVREAVGPDALILANANDHTTPRTAPFINGYFMECYRSKNATDWARISKTLSWAERNLREPRINCLETWYHQSRRDLHLMRATTALALTHSDGYCLFSDPNSLPTGDHRHDWYPFWQKGLGRPAGPATTRSDGAVIRRFTKGWTVYNPMGNREVTLAFPEPVASRATGQTGRTHRLAAPDGDVFVSGRTEPSE